MSGRDPEVRPKARPQESGRRHQEAKKPLRKRQGGGASPRAAGSPAPAGCCRQAGHRHAPFPRGGLAVTPPSPNIQMVLSAPAPPSSQGRARPALPKVSPCHPSHPTPHTFLPRAHFSVVRCTREQIRLHTQHCVAGSSQTQNAGLPSRRRASGAAPVPLETRPEPGVLLGDDPARGPIPQRKGRSDVCPSKQSEWRRCPLCAEPLPLLRCDDFTVAACPQTPPSQRSCVDDYKDGGALGCPRALFCKYGPREAWASAACGAVWTQPGCHL